MNVLAKLKSGLAVVKTPMSIMGGLGGIEGAWKGVTAGVLLLLLVLDYGVCMCLVVRCVYYTGRWQLLSSSGLLKMKRESNTREKKQKRPSQHPVSPRLRPGYPFQRSHSWPSAGRKVDCTRARLRNSSASA